MKLSHTLGLAAFTALVAGSGIASAGTIYGVHGTLVSVSGALCSAFQQYVGTPSNITVYVPNANAVNMTIISPATPPTAAKAGSAGTYACIAQTTTATTTLAFGATPIVFNCYQNTTPQAKAPATPVATITSTFAATATHTGTSQTALGATLNVETNSTLTVAGAGSCSTVTDSTWTAE